MRRTTTILLALLALVALIAGACGDDDTTTTDDTTTDDTTTTDTTTTDDTTTTTDDTTTTTDETTTTDDTTTDDTITGPPRDVPVYFVGEVGAPSAGGVVEAVAGTTRAIPGSTDGHPGLLVLESLLDGPNDLEVEIGMTSAVPEATEILGLTVEGGIATIDVDAAFEEADGAFSDTLRVAQVVFALTAFDDVDTVRFAVDGEVRDVIGSHGVEVDGSGDGLGRDDIPEARPPILLESLAPGDDVTAPLTIRGEANTFEATVRWALAGPDGEILDEGFLTATAGNGVWGTFEAEIGAGATADRSGLGAVILWEDSPEDGRQTNIVEVPIRWTED